MLRRSALPLLTILIVCSATLGGLLLTPSPTSWDDGLRHLTMARVMHAEGIDQTWDRFLYGGYLSKHPVDPWFLADISYIPFTGLQSALALKLYSVLGLAALMLALWYAIAPLGLSSAVTSVLLLLLVVPEGFYGRLLLGRPFVWSTVFAVLALDAVMRRRWIALGVILLVATLFSQLFVFPLILAVCGVLWLLTLGQRAPATKATAAIITGVVAGTALHPHALNYVIYITTVFLRIPFEAHSLNLGTEMYPGLLSSVGPLAILGALLLICAGAHVHGRPLNLKALHANGTTLLGALVAVSFLAYVFAWNRMIDVLLPLLILLAAYLLKHIEPFVRELLTIRRLLPLFPRVQGRTLLCGAIIVLAAATIARASISFAKSAENRSLAHAAVLSDLPAGSRVLNPEWFYFPAFVHSNPTLQFATGIDNTFTAVENPEAYQLLEVAFSPASIIPRPVVDTRAWIAQLLEHFPSDYLVLSNGWGKNLLPLLRETPGLKELTESGAVIEVFEIGEEFGAAN